MAASVTSLGSGAPKQFPMADVRRKGPWCRNKVKETITVACPAKSDVKVGTSEKARENGNSERKCKVVCIKKKKDQRVEVQVPEVKFNLEWRLETKLGFFSFFFFCFLFSSPFYLLLFWLFFLFLSIPTLRVN